MKRLANRGAAMDVGGWLRRLGLEQYEASFRDNEINERVLPSLTQEDLKEIGIGPVGHRRMLLEAIAALHADYGGNAPAADAATTSSAPGISPEDRAERRQVTVMFCDLVGSTALSTRMDPEDLREVISAYQNSVAVTVGRFGGFVARYIGDGVLAYFDYPHAHEHDAERAVRAGLELVEEAPKLKTAAGVPLQVRVGIATGLVVVGDLIGGGSVQEHEVVGETPNLAARLQTLAEPGTVVISSSTRGLTGGLFDYRDLGTVALKGFAEMVLAWQVLGASAAESRFKALRASTTPLVGRGEEIDLLLRRWEQAKGGEGSVVLLASEPGIGKSRIAETIFERLSGEPHTRLRHFCSPHHQDTALYPSITQLERAAGFRRDDTDEQRLTKLEAVLALAANDLGEAVPLLAGLLSIPTGDRYPALDLTPQKRKEKTLRALVAQVEGLAARQPVLLVVEDAHWADPTSLELFELIVERVSSLPLVAIVTFRPEFVPPWVGRSQVALISLSRLSRRLRAESRRQQAAATPAE
jgi:class 3 adenylate cyclase